MNKNEKTRPVAATTKRAEETAAFGGAAISYSNFTTQKRARQVSDYLLNGAENALDARTLAALMKIDRRTVTQRIERERRSGMPICAAVTGRNRGYFLPASPAELEQYVSSLNRRVKEVSLTLNACTKTLKKMKRGV